MATIDYRVQWYMTPLGPKINYPLGPTGDMQTISGPDKAVQDALNYLLNAYASSPFDPRWGSTAFSHQGRPQTSDPQDVVDDVVAHMEDYFHTANASALAQGIALSSDEMIDHVGGAGYVIDPLNPGYITLSLTLITVAGARRVLTTPFSLSLIA